MKFRKFLRFGAIALLLLMVVKSGWYIHQYELLPRWWFNITQSVKGDGQPKGKLDGYEAVIQRKKIEGAKGLSSLTYNDVSGTLFTTGDDNSEILELSTSGDVLRTIPIEGFEEVEAIEHIDGNRFLILEEPLNQLSIIEINRDTTLVNSYLSRISLGIELNNRNKNFEGLAFSRKLDRIYVGKERDPIRIYEIEGFTSERKPQKIAIRGDQERERRLFIKDLSGLEVDPATGHLLVLSHESRLVLELDEHDQPSSSLSLLKWQGNLTQLIQQAEGLAVGPDDTIYIMSEPNLFYSFKKVEG